MAEASATLSRLPRAEAPQLAMTVITEVSARQGDRGPRRSSPSARPQRSQNPNWFKSPIVSTAAYIKIEEGGLRKKIETILIRFLKRNAVINKQNVER
jgi:hypothetical protein